MLEWIVGYFGIGLIVCIVGFFWHGLRGNEEISDEFMEFGLSPGCGLVFWPVLLVLVFKGEFKKGRYPEPVRVKKPQGTDQETHVGEIAIVVQELRPVGRVKIEGGIFDAISNGEIIEEGKEVMITGANGFDLVVKRRSSENLEESEQDAALKSDPRAR